MRGPVIRLHSVEETRACGERVGRVLTGGEVIALHGPLGAGKTQLTKGIALGLEIPSGEPVVSPTFVLARSYHGRLELHHFDAYRLTDAEELFAIGFEEVAGDAACVVVVEWAERAAEVMPATAVHLTLSHVSCEVRELAVVAGPDRLLAALEGALDPA